MKLAFNFNLTLICLVPPIYLPEALREVNSSSSEDVSAAPGSRRRRDADTEDSGNWKLLDRQWNFVRTGSWHWSANSSPRRLRRQKRAPVSFISNMNVSTSLYLGFVMKVSIDRSID